MRDTEREGDPKYATEKGEIGTAEIVYTEDELEAMRQVQIALLETHGIEKGRVGPRFLAIATINCKCRVDEATKKIHKLLQIMEKLDCPDGLTESESFESEESLLRPEAIDELRSYSPTGPDGQGATLVWIVGGRSVPKTAQRNHVHACVMHFLAEHADAISLHQGITFVIDVSLTPKDPKVGNERMIQSFYQAFPQRPQAIYIVGTNAVTRAVVNTSIKLASLITSQKVLDRVKFLTVEQAVAKVPASSAPTYVGGQGGGITSTVEWVKERLGRIPVPDL